MPDLIWPRKPSVAYTVHLWNMIHHVLGYKYRMLLFLIKNRKF